MVQDRDMVAIGTLIGNRMWSIEWRYCRCPWMTSDVTFAVWSLSTSSHIAWNIAQIY